MAVATTTINGATLTFSYHKRFGYKPFVWVVGKLLWIIIPFVGVRKTLRIRDKAAHFAVDHLVQFDT